MEHPAIAPRLLCLSHLRWGFVWQRPQHLLTRLAADYDLCFVEEPEFTDEPGPRLRVSQDAGVTILTPLLPIAAGYDWGFNAGTNPVIRQLLEATALGAEPRAGDVVWYYTPMALGAAPEPFASAFTIFDAMDELANFRGAPRELVLREQELMARADLVFAGGPSLYDQRKEHHPSVHCFPSGVDAAHFAPDPGRATPADAAAWRSPVIGFYGVLDERIDGDLVAAVAGLRPDWTLVLIGPLAKIAETDLPRRPNIVYPGKRDYRELPAYLDRFDVAVLPFALNDATKFISPTKTLEYLAAGKPVVSTPIHDVIRLYGDAVEIAATPAEFVHKVESSLAGPNRARREAARALIAAHEWDRIAAEMRRLIACRQQAPDARVPQGAFAR